MHLLEYESQEDKYGHHSVNYEVIKSEDPYQLYSTINECDMMSNFYQNICLSSPESDTWSEDTLKRPSSPSLLQSCYQEMEKKGLGVFQHHQQNFPASSVKTKISLSNIENWNHGRANSKSKMSESPPIPCSGQFTTSAEVHNIYLEEKPGLDNCFTERGKYQSKEDSDNDQGNSKTHAVNLDTAIDKSKPVANQEIAVSDKEQSTPSTEDFNGSPIQYEDALSIYEVYIL